MSFPVRYYCPRCETVHTLQRSGYLADKSVTPYPLEGWTYAAVGGDYEAADGIRVVCGEATVDGPETDVADRDGDDDADIDAEGDADVEGNADVEGDAPVLVDGAGCGEPFYLNFVRFDDGEEVEPEPESERVELAAERPRGPRTPGGPGL